MYITRQADYTMRLLIHLAVQGDGAATIQEIAERYHISRAHLMKVANRAVRAGYVEAVRGRSGGLRLGKPAEKINIGQVFRTMEDTTLVECFDTGSNRCPITEGCGLRPVLRKALDSYLAVLDRYSLADVVERRPSLIQLLHLKAG
ncbi:MAG TPA: Rrf2 family transcriptional regulator [Bryobacteraceae bacterium]|jgi:Rrf2 family nitric oxide-sensitive transcriptional repressor|nr:Rrf2 family transcriptional regulator [Bryobacteraceae bacterium]